MTFSSKTFKFFIDDQVHFSCRLKSIQCEARNADGHQCKKWSVVGTPLCWIHLLHQKHLRIKPSRYGQGLFASDPKKGEHAVVFRKGQTIMEMLLMKPKLLGDMMDLLLHMVWELAKMFTKMELVIEALVD